MTTSPAQIWSAEKIFLVMFKRSRLCMSALYMYATALFDNASLQNTMHPLTKTRQDRELRQSCCRLLLLNNVKMRKAVLSKSNEWFNFTFYSQNQLKKWSSPKNESRFNPVQNDDGYVYQLCSEASSFPGGKAAPEYSRNVAQTYLAGSVSIVTG